MKRRSWLLAVMFAMASGGLAVALDVDEDGVPDEFDVCCNTAAGSVVDSTGRPYGDADADCDVDLADYAILTNNFTGPRPCSTELCDGIDNDCNCIVDDVPAISCGLGACFQQVPGCVNGEINSCIPLQPGIESCNGIDDNCDGDVDDPFDLQSDIMNCGTCGIVCPARAHANTLCGDGQCAFACVSSYGNCDQNPTNGCEVNLTNNAQHCSACNLACPTYPHAYRPCVNSVCANWINCDPGYDNCNGQTADGCEANLSGPDNCGYCGHYCPRDAHSTAVCQAGVMCAVNCAPGWQNCDGSGTCETNILTDPDNCGFCSWPCDAGQSCVNGQCVQP